MDIHHHLPPHLYPFCALYARIWNVYDPFYASVYVALRPFWHYHLILLHYHYDLWDCPPHLAGNLYSLQSIVMKHVYPPYTYYYYLIHSNLPTLDPSSRVVQPQNYYLYNKMYFGNVLIRHVNCQFYQRIMFWAMGPIFYLRHIDHVVVRTMSLHPTLIIYRHVVYYVICGVDHHL